MLPPELLLRRCFAYWSEYVLYAAAASAVPSCLQGQGLSHPVGVNCAVGKGMRENISQGSSAQPGVSQHSFVGML